VVEQGELPVYDPKQLNTDNLYARVIMSRGTVEFENIIRQDTSSQNTVLSLLEARDENPKAVAQQVNVFYHCYDPRVLPTTYKIVPPHYAKAAAQLKLAMEPHIFESEFIEALHRDIRSQLPEIQAHWPMRVAEELHRFLSTSTEPNKNAPTWSDFVDSEESRLARVVAIVLRNNRFRNSYSAMHNPGSGGGVLTGIKGNLALQRLDLNLPLLAVGPKAHYRNRLSSLIQEGVALSMDHPEQAELFSRAVDSAVVGGVGSDRGRQDFIDSHPEIKRVIERHDEGVTAAIRVNSIYFNSGGFPGDKNDSGKLLYPTLYIPTGIHP